MKLPIDLTQEQQQLSRQVLDAYFQYLNFREIGFDLGLLGGHLNGESTQFEHPVSERLKVLLQQAKELAKEFENHNSEIEDLYIEAAWKYCAAIYHLRRGDFVEFTNLKGQSLSIVTESITVTLSPHPPVGLYVSGRALRKDGSLGKRVESVFLNDTRWKVTRHDNQK